MTNIERECRKSIAKAAFIQLFNCGGSMWIYEAGIWLCRQLNWKPAWKAAL